MHTYCNPQSLNARKACSVFFFLVFNFSSNLSKIIWFWFQIICCIIQIFKKFISFFDFINDSVLVRDPRTIWTIWPDIRGPKRIRPWTQSFDDLFCLLKFRFYFIECFLIKCFCFQVCHFLCFIVACVILYFRPVWFDPWPWDSSLKFEPWGWKILKISALSFQKKTLSF